MKNFNFSTFKKINFGFLQREVSSRGRLAQRDNSCFVIFYAQQTMVSNLAVGQDFVHAQFIHKCMTLISLKHDLATSNRRCQKKLSQQEIPLSKRGSVT